MSTTTRPQVTVDPNDHGRAELSLWKQTIMNNPYRKTGVKRPLPYKEAPIRKPPATATSENTVNLEDSFDSGIDWDAACQVLDQVDASSTQPAAAAVSAPAAVHPPLQAAPQPPTAHGRRPPPSQTSSTRPPQSTVASLRPTSWKTESPVAAKSPLTRSPPAASPLDPCQARLPPSLRFGPDAVQPVSDEHRAALIKNAALSEPLDNGMMLYSHQKKAVLRGLLMRKCLLAMDMGTGKTLTACVWMRAYCRTFKVKPIVLVPVSMRQEWQRSLENMTGLEVGSECDDSTNVYIGSWGKVPTQVPGDGKYIVVADEAHMMQSMTAARTVAALQLMRDRRCVGALLLTGTPMKNGRPANLFPLLRAIGHPLGRDQKAYEIHFCNAYMQSFGPRQTWNASGSSNLDQLHQLTAQHILYLHKDEVLKELPAQTRQKKQVAVSSRRQMQHNQALQDLAKVYHAPGKDNSDAVLGAVQKVRLVGSLAKIDATVATALDTLKREPAIVIFTSFVEVAKTVHKQLAEAGWHGELLTGETPPAKRQKMVDNFQEGLSSVFCCTFGAGGVGLTLTAARTVILLDRPWTPGDAQQAEDRVRRIGQTFPVTSIWMSAFDLDASIDSILEQKRQTAAAVLENSGGASLAAAAPKLSIMSMLRTILPGPNGLGSSDRMTQTSILNYSQAS